MVVINIIIIRAARWVQILIEISLIIEHELIVKGKET